MTSSSRPDITIRIPNLEALPAAADAFLEAVEGFTVFAFTGGMGAGKTTFINALATRLGVDVDPTGSPTFAILNEYLGRDGHTIHHFDLYRLETEEEVAETGFTEYVDSGDMCLIEWPDRAGSLLIPEETVEVDIDVDPHTDERTMTLRFPRR